MHRPAIPEDLLPPELLWARWGLHAVVTNTSEGEQSFQRAGLWAREDRLRYDDSGCTRWWFDRCGPGRYVLFGQDDAGKVDWYEPAIDMLAGGPQWLPYKKLRYMLDGHELGCVYWYENGAWDRAPYPDDVKDDGLDEGLGFLHSRERTLRSLQGLDGSGLDPGLPQHVAERLLDAAETYQLTPELLEFARQELLEELEDDDDEWQQTEGETLQELLVVVRALELTGLNGGAAAK